MNETQQDKSLYWYGFRAKAKQGFGKVLLFIGLSTFFIFNYIIGGLIIALGIFLLTTGKSQEYDYKITGGHILYND